ncbi:hypothetical protein GCM10009838_62230 [Catenulispora subtropica]|uniref:FAD/NAD(P)-binding domain-containing protein n=1 Tax=Catenulispora subtropica TaxID=450798 RepID=A0ABP5E2J5_9ACTN
MDVNGLLDDAGVGRAVRGLGGGDPSEYGICGRWCSGPPDDMRAQAERFGAQIVTDDAVSVNLNGPIKGVVNTDGAIHMAKTVIVATGSGYRKLGLPREDELSGRGVSWCATCDGFFFRDQDIAVVGGGDTALEEATFLSRFAHSVRVIHRRGELRAFKTMQNRAQNDPKISFAFNTEFSHIHGDDALTGLTLLDATTGTTRDHTATGLFIAIGHDPRSELQVEGRSSGRTSRGLRLRRRRRPHVPPGHHRRGSGCAAALDAERYLAALLGEEKTTGQMAEALT